jgi:hypothetical protein
MDPNSNSYNNYSTPNQYGGTFFDQIRYSKRINGLEILTILFCVIVLIASFAMGFLNAQQSNEDAQRFAHIDQVNNALIEFYNNSSAVPSQRSYPIAICSADANEVDFELTLRLSLTGKIKEKDIHAYIEPSNFPKDIAGQYSKSLANRKVPYRCPALASPETTTNSSADIYADGWESCNFNKRTNPKCYLYASSNNGDTFTLGYFSQQQNRFILFTKFRDQPAVRTFS